MLFIKQWLVKRAQAATEYLIILGVVIIIALIGVGMMAGIPGIGSVTKQRTSAAYWDSAEIGISSYAIDGSDGSAKLLISNNFRDAITISEVKLGDSLLDTSDQALNSGDTKLFTADTEFSSLCAPGVSFSLAVSITYTDSVSGKEYVFTGDGHKLEGVCSE